MATYDISGHALLSTRAAGLGSAALTAQGELAEDLLGLAGTTFDGAKAATAKRAVVLQVNYQLETEGADALKSESKGRQSRSYRSSKSGALLPVSQRAHELARALLGTNDWSTVTRVR